MILTFILGRVYFFTEYRIFNQQLFYFHTLKMPFQCLNFCGDFNFGITIATLKSLSIFSLSQLDYSHFLCFSSILDTILFVLIEIGVYRASCICSLMCFVSFETQLLSLQILNCCILLPLFCIIVLDRFTTLQMSLYCFQYFKNLFTFLGFNPLFSFQFVFSFSTLANMWNWIAKSDLCKSEILPSINCY